MIRLTAVFLLLTTITSCSVATEDSNLQSDSNLVIPILLADFYPESIEGSLISDVLYNMSEDIADELMKSGRFKVLRRANHEQAAGYSEFPYHDGDEKFERINNTGIEYLVVVRMSINSRKRTYGLAFQLLDVKNKRDIIGHNFVAALGDVRSTGHDIAKLILEELANQQKNISTAPSSVPASIIKLISPGKGAALAAGAVNGNVYKAKKMGMAFDTNQWPAIEKNRKAAAYFFEIAAKSGDQQSLKHLGRIYFEGNGIDRNLVKSAEYYQKATNISPSDQQAYSGLAKTLVALGEKDNAKEATAWAKTQKDRESALAKAVSERRAAIKSQKAVTFKPVKNASQLAVDSFTSHGLNYASELMAIYLGDFKSARLRTNSSETNELFLHYLKAYGKHCAAYLPSNKVAITFRTCATQRVTKNGFGTVTNTSCASWVNAPTSLYADPTLYESQKKLSKKVSGKFLNYNLRDLSHTRIKMNQIQELTNALPKIKNDMNNLVKNNKCGNAGVTRFEENLYRFVENKDPLLLPGKNTLASTRKTNPSEFRFDDINFRILLNDLVIEQSKSWLINGYSRNTISDPRVMNRNSDGSHRVVAAEYISIDPKRRTKATVELLFIDGLPNCLTFSDASSICRPPSREIVNKFERGVYIK